MEMPADTYFADALEKAVKSGEVPMSRLDDMVHRLLRTEFTVGLFDHPPVRKVVDIFAGFEVAQRVAEQGTVLLKNAQGQLPLSASRLKSIAIIGSHADIAVLSGGGSAQVDPPGGNAVPPPVPPGASPMGIFDQVVWDPSSPLKAIRAKAANAKVEYNAVYVSLPASAGEPPKRLVGWDKVHLAPGEAKTVNLTLDPHYLSVFNADKGGWELVAGDYKFWVGGSSRNLPLSQIAKIGD